jgi:hypothetical protein
MTPTEARWKAVGRVGAGCVRRLEDAGLAIVEAPAPSDLETEIVAELTETLAEVLAHLHGSPARTTRADAVRKARHLLALHQEEE